MTIYSGEKKRTQKSSSVALYHHQSTKYILNKYILFYQILYSNCELSLFSWTYSLNSWLKWVKVKVGTWPCHPLKKIPIHKNPSKSHVVWSLICNITVQNMRWPCRTTFVFAIKPNSSHFSIKYTQGTITFGPTTDSVPSKSLKITHCMYLYIHYHCAKCIMAFPR